MTTSLHNIVKRKRKVLKLTQKELSMRAGVGLRFLRELEQGKQTLKMDKVNQVLRFLGYEIGAIELNGHIQEKENQWEDISSL